MSRRLIITHATAATVVHWATHGPKRLRAKYRHALTACRVLNRREAPLVGVDTEGKVGCIAAIKFAWGSGFISRAISEWNTRTWSTRWVYARLGWYGDWHVRHGGLTMALHSRADLRTWARRGCPTTRPGFFQPAGALGNTESRRRLLGRSRPW